MSELRLDPFTRTWVVIAPDRERRPRLVRATSGSRPAIVDPGCPFCPGHEQSTPPELWRLPTSSPGSGDWAVRVVPNRYPVLAGNGQFAPRPATELLTSADGAGSHEVVVESPRHDWDLADGDEDAVVNVLRAYRARSIVLRTRRPGFVLPFRNHGADAGTSLPHPHSQIVATPIVPLRHRQLLDVARDYYDLHAECLYTRYTEAEVADGRRVVAATARVAALAPYAAREPYETWIVPRHHQAAFADADDGILTDTARVLHRVLAALRELLGDVPYNYVLISAPNGEETTDYFSWHLQLVPRLAETAGFELGSGIAVNPVPPEQAADHLRRNGTAP